MQIHFQLSQIAAVAVIFMTSAAGLLARPPSEWLLGPTGLTGSYAKQSIQVTKVAEGSPADGLVQVGDEIIGLNSAKFGGEVRRELAAAIDRAETEEFGGRLTLLLKDKRVVDLQLKVMGAYSPSAPYDCAKSDRIIREAADYLAAQIESSLDPENKRSRGTFNSGATHSALLGLMATGEPRYIDLVARAIHSSDTASPDVERIEELLNGGRDMGYVGWYWGYDCILLGEYYLLTGDTSVLPALKTYALALARGQDAGGLWGHRMATNGRLPGYAQMNQSSLSSFLGMLYARKCGIQDPILEKGIEKTYAYFAPHIGKGTFKYGVHGPNPKAFNNNGMSGSAALSFALAGNREGVAYYSNLCAASYDDLEQGHASNFFNPLWTPVGAGFSGPDVTSRFFKNSLWLLTTYRDWDGKFLSRGAESFKEGSMTGVALLVYCLPRRALIMTGKEGDQSIWLEGDEAEEVVRMSQFDYASMSEDELLSLFDHPFSMVRIPAVWALRGRNSSFLPRVVEMLEQGSSAEKTSAMEYFGYQCPPEQAYPQLEKIAAILVDKEQDLELREKAAVVLSFHGEAAYRYYNDILQLVVDEVPGDKSMFLAASLGESLVRMCGTPFASGLVTDKPLFFAASDILMGHKWQDARSAGIKMLGDMPLEDLHHVADDLMHIIQDQDRSYHSYHGWQHTIGPAIELLAGLNIKEGLPYAAGILDRDGGKWGFKVRMLCAALPKYGANAKDALAKIKSDERLKNIENDKFAGIWRRMVQAIEEDTEPRNLVTLEEALRMAEQ